MSKSKNWIADAIQHPGALKAKAKKAGAVTKKGTIESDWLEKQAEKKGTVGKQARLAKTLKGFSKKK